MDIDLFRRFREWHGEKVGAITGRLALEGYTPEIKNWLYVELRVGASRAVINVLTGRFKVYKTYHMLGASKPEIITVHGYLFESLLEHLEKVKDMDRHDKEMNKAMRDAFLRMAEMKKCQENESTTKQ